MIQLNVAWRAFAALLALAPSASAQWNGSQYVPHWGEAVFYEKANCSGEPYVALREGNYPDLTQMSSAQGSWNDKISCIVAGGGTRVTVYEHVNYRTPSAVVTTGQHSLSGQSLDNKVSSIKIVQTAPPPTPPMPSVRLTINGSTSTVQVPIMSNIAVQWTSQNVTSCTATGAWSGAKATSGSEPPAPIASPKTYTLTCSGQYGTAAASVTANVVSSGGTAAGGGSSGGGTAPKHK